MTREDAMEEQEQFSHTDQSTTVRTLLGSTGNKIL